jgi:adenosine deaminase
MTYQLPKVELHKHLEGSIRLNSLCEFSGLSVEEAKKRFWVTQPMESLKHVLDSFIETQKLLNSYERIEQISFEVVEDAALDNTKLLEVRYAPDFLNAGHNLDPQESLEAICSGIKKAEETYPIKVGLIGILVRSMDLQAATKSLDFILANKDKFIALDLADQEKGFSPSLFADLFSKAKQEGLKITVHAGEENIEEACDNIESAVTELGADRIGHGLQCVKQVKTMELLRDRNIHLELCPLSNWITGAVTKKEQHPLKQIFDFGIPCSINSDDPGVFGSSLQEDYKIGKELLGLDNDHFRRMNQMAFEACFIPSKNEFRKDFY